MGRLIDMCVVCLSLPLPLSLPNQYMTIKQGGVGFPVTRVVTAHALDYGHVGQQGSEYRACPTAGQPGAGCSPRWPPPDPTLLPCRSGVPQRVSDYFPWGWCVGRESHQQATPAQPTAGPPSRALSGPSGITNSNRRSSIFKRK